MYNRTYVRAGLSTLPNAAMNAATVDREVRELQVQVKLLGAQDAATGRWSVPFGTLYDKTQDIFEALAGTLKSAKKRGLIDYSAPLLLKGTHDKVAIVLLKEAEAEPEAGGGAGGGHA